MFHKKNKKDLRLWIFIVSVLMFAYLLATDNTTTITEPSHGGNVTAKGILLGLVIVCSPLIIYFVKKGGSIVVSETCEIADQELERINE